MDFTVKLLPPVSPPNFIRVDVGNGQNIQIDLGQLTADQAEEYAEMAKQEILKNWEKRSIICKTDQRAKESAELLEKSKGVHEVPDWAKREFYLVKEQKEQVNDLDESARSMRGEQNCRGGLPT